MALFLKAEAGEATQGRPPAVVTAFKAAAALALENDDEVYGCLCAWNAVKAIKDGGKPYCIGDVLCLLDAAYTCKQQMIHWGAYMMVEPRINVIKSMKSDIKVGSCILHRSVSGLMTTPEKFVESMRQSAGTT